MMGIRDLELAASAGATMVVVLRGDIFDVPAMVQSASTSGMSVFLHIDLTEGIGKDKAGLRFLAQKVGVTGIVTTRAHLVRDAHTVGLQTILRFFVLDSLAYDTGVAMARSARPDAIELLPGVVLPRITADVRRDIKLPVIAAGLIRTEQDVREALRSGVVAVFTTQHELWGLRR